MKDTRLPVYVPQRPTPARKVSAGHLDALYSALMAAISRFPLPFSADLIGHLTTLHNQMIIMLEDDASLTISTFKSLRRFYIEFMRGNVLGPDCIREAEWDSLSDRPSKLVEVCKLRTSLLLSTDTVSPNIIFMDRVIVGYLDGSRVIVVPGSASYASIEADPVPGSKPTLPGFENALSRIGISPCEFQKVYKEKCLKSTYKVITTAGPNGQATWSAADDAKAIRGHEAVRNAFRVLSSYNGLDFIFSDMLGTEDAPDNVHIPTTEPILGRLHPIEEWGGKVRVVAILDYWTQMLLSPLHETINHFLRQLSSDGTFDQLHVAELVRAWTSQSGLQINSFDLTAATDRIPIAFQADVLGHLMGDSKFGLAWKELLVSRPYHDPAGKEHYYKVGQPMGAKSSFPMLALIHHIIVQMAAEEAKVEPYLDYVIVGDDNTHTNPDVAVKYQQIMGRLGVPINRDKSIVHVTDCDTAAEICKRVFINGVEVTSFPAKLIVKVTKFGHMVSGLQNQLAIRGNPLPDTAVLPWLSHLIDPKSMQGLYILNSVPSEVSGLLRPIPTGFKNLNLDSWFKGVHLTPEDVINAFTFALITEQLKRVDQLMKGTQVMSELLFSKAGDEFTMVLDYPEWSVSSSLSPDAKAEALSKLPPLTLTHPVIKASMEEMNRISSHLAAIRSGAPEMVARARTGLLDVLRNSISEIWLGKDEGSQRVQRSIFNAALGTLNRVCTKSDSREVEFSLLISHVQRMWSVHWKLGGPVHLNVVKSRVSINTMDTDSAIAKAVSGIDFSSARL